MIVTLSVRPPTGTAREFEFRRAAIQVGAGFRNDVIIPSVREVARILRVDVASSGFRVVPLTREEKVRVVLPGQELEKEPEESLIVPIGTRILIGEPLTTTVTLTGLRREGVVQTTALELVAVPPLQDVVEGMDAAVVRDFARFAYAVAAEETPHGFASALDAFVRADASSGVLQVLLVLPEGGESPWDRVAAYGTTAQRAPWDFSGADGGTLVESLSQGRAMFMRRGEERFVLVPVVSDARLWAIVSVQLDREVQAIPDAIGARLRAGRPLISAFSQRSGRQQTVEAHREENRYFRDRQRRHYLFKDLVSESPSMRRLHRRLGELVSGDQPVLLAGESGTGKELLARALHHLGGRAGGMMISLNCGAVDEDTLDIELFGYSRAAEGGAGASRRGVFELARSGTVFLDEIHALSPRLQTKLNRLVVESEVFRIGESVGRPVDVRFVAASHRDLGKLADEGLFRPDLAALLARNVLEVPALRDRREDIRPLVDAFARQYGRRYKKRTRTVEPETMIWLTQLRWPGNVRELQSVMERAVLQADAEREVLARADFEFR